MNRFRLTLWPCVLALALAGWGCREPVAPSAETSAIAGIPVFSYDVVRRFPHDPAAFTQGLQIHEGALYESTGRYGRSSLRLVDIESGRVIRRVNLPDRYFGEGIAVVGDAVYMLTWREQTAFQFDRSTFQLRRTFSYEGEGWGLAFDGQHLVMSDGTHRLRFIEPETFEVTRVLDITADGKPVRLLNELAWIKGEIWANVFLSDRLARIDPETGQVTAWVDLSGILASPDKTRDADVLNGIAYDPISDRLFVTGKLWPALYEITVIPPSL